MFSLRIFRKNRLSECAKALWCRVFLLALCCGGFQCLAQSIELGYASDLARKESQTVVTNVAQFRALSPEVFLGRCAFQLNGVVTLVDTNRDLLVLQDETGAVVFNPQTGVRNVGVQAGQRVTIEGPRCFPHVVGFPGFPYRPSGWEVRSLFEAPANFGNYYMTRMRGFLHPPVTGEYTFWVASDNSSELWLSADADPTKVKKVAFQSRFSWVAPREWSHYPAQRSENIFLEAGRTYYLEAFHEQTTGGDHLAVAWQGPSVKQAVIDDRYLTPWVEHRDQVAAAATNGVLREYWTNFSLGGLATLTGPKSFESILSVDALQVTPREAPVWPEPQAIALNQQLQAADNYLWVEAQGKVTFTGRNGGVGFLELSDGEVAIQVRVMPGDVEALRRFHHALVRVVGVCEGVYDQKGVLVPGLIWVMQADGISLIDDAEAQALPALATGRATKLVLTNSNPAMLGFYTTRGVVTFNDRVFDQDCMFVQEDTAAMFVSFKNRDYGNKFEVGRWVDLGGALQPGKNIPLLNPMVVTELGWRSMPAPMPPPVQFPVPGSRDGRWTEAEGVVHTVNSNGTITLMGSAPLAVWIGKTTTNQLASYVDAKLRVRGVLSLTIQDAPLLLVSSPSFVDVEREAPRDPFAVPACPVSDLAGAGEMGHRVKLVGHVTYAGPNSFFVQDASGGLRVWPAVPQTLAVGQAIETVGFFGPNGAARVLTEALVRLAGEKRVVTPQKLDAGEGVSFKQAGTLVQINANLIAQRTRGDRQVLELQEKQRVFEAELLRDMTLPNFAPGTRLQLSGVCDFTTVAPTAAVSMAAESPSTGALKIWLRSPADVVLLSGPPWWTWKYTAVLIGALLLVVAVSLLRIHLLRRRLERQLVFSRQILESQESERHRIAANLHDGLGQNLLVIKNQAKLAMQPAPEESVLQQRLDEISDCASRAIVEVREITHALRPYQLDRLGLTQTIRATVSQAAENSSILFASHADDVDGAFDKESEIHVYRIVQEAVNNILKHSAATEAAVVIKKLTAAVSISIRDNGRGFDVATLHAADSHDVGHGLSGIKERVRILGGMFVIDSRAGNGTTLSIEIPVSASKT